MDAGAWLGNFVIGSSFLVVAPFFIGARSMSDLGLSLDRYAFIAPLFFGILNAVSAAVAARYGVNQRTRLFWTSQLSAALVIAFLLLTQPYPISQERYAQHYLLVWVSHFLVWNFVIAFLQQLF